MENIVEQVRELCEKTRAAAPALASASDKERNGALTAIARALRESAEAILAANREDLERAEENGLPKAMMDRLRLTEERIDGIASAVEELVRLDSPLGRGETWTRPNGLAITSIRVPMGVVGMIYEARPNVTVDAAALCLKAGCACVLRGGKEAIHTNLCLAEVMGNALASCGMSPDLIGLIRCTDRESAAALMGMRGLIDVLIPRGGKGLIRSVVEQAKVPVIETGAGNCHLYVHKGCDLEQAAAVAVNAKCSRPSVCNAIETLLVHRDEAEAFLPLLMKEMAGWTVEIRGCERTRAILPSAVPADEEDYFTEYNDYILAVKVVDSLEEAIAHINAHGTGHSEAIMTRDIAAAKKFQQEVDAAAVYVNASTRFTDGGEFGFGAEIGISTQKLHARGPMGLNALTTVKYLIEGDGQIR